MKFSTISVKTFDRCEKGEAKFIQTQIQVIKGTESQESLKFNRIALIEGEQCKEKECIAGVPEWWQIRPEGHRPQVILQFGEYQEGKIGSPKFPITVFHPIAEALQIQCPIDSYVKGNCEGILTLNDNAKLIVNCIDKEECTRIIELLKNYINQDYLVGASSKIGDRLGEPIQVREVRPKQAKYFSQGLRSLNPDWIAYY